jgi:ketosteroid isomerase-like protein
MPPVFALAPEEPTMKRLSTIMLCLLALTVSSLAQPPQSAGKRSAAKKSTAPAAPDKSYLQQIWTGWSTLNPANVEKFYASGPHTFFDIAPLKYNSWDEYENGVKAVVSGYKSAKFTLNDDVAIHPHGDLVWATATISEEMTTKAGKIDMGNFRWTVIFENQDGEWKIVHEHVSAPLS